MDCYFDMTINVIISFRKTFPEFVVGFDLVGQEDKGRPLYEQLPALKELPPNSRLFLHAGETS